jgi:hypothetical protein
MCSPDAPACGHLPDNWTKDGRRRGRLLPLRSRVRQVCVVSISSTTGPTARNPSLSRIGRHSADAWVTRIGVPAATASSQRAGTSAREAPRPGASGRVPPGERDDADERLRGVPTCRDVGAVHRLTGRWPSTPAARARSTQARARHGRLAGIIDEGRPMASLTNHKDQAQIAYVRREKPGDPQISATAPNSPFTSSPSTDRPRPNASGMTWLCPFGTRLSTAARNCGSAHRVAAMFDRLVP